MQTAAVEIDGQQQMSAVKIERCRYLAGAGQLPNPKRTHSLHVHAAHQCLPSSRKLVTAEGALSPAPPACEPLQNRIVWECA